MAETVRIDPRTHAKLTVLARAKQLSLTEVLARAVESYDRAELLARFNADYAALRADVPAWRAELDERAEWDSTHLDGLENERKTKSVRAPRKAAKSSRAAKGAARAKRASRKGKKP